jgi:hypothetical protein
MASNHVQVSLKDEILERNLSAKAINNNMPSIFQFAQVSCIWVDKQRASTINIINLLWWVYNASPPYRTDFHEFAQVIQ